MDLNPTDSDIRLLWFRDDLKTDSSIISARIDGVYYQYAGLPNSVAFFLVINHRGTDYRATLYTEQVASNSDLLAKYGGHLNHIITRYGKSSANKIIQLFLRNSRNPTICRLLSQFK